MDLSPAFRAQESSSPSPGPFARCTWEALGFWEPRRAVFNLLLVVVLAGWIVGTWPHFRPAMTPYGAFQLAILALLANFFYSAAYLLEPLFALAAPAPRPLLRGALWVFGTALAILLENFWIADEIYPFVGR